MKNHAHRGYYGMGHTIEATIPYAPYRMGHGFFIVGGATSECDTWFMVETHQSVTLSHVNSSTSTEFHMGKCHTLMWFHPKQEHTWSGNFYYM